MNSPQGQVFEELRNTLSECSRVIRHRWRLSTLTLSAVGAAAFWFSQYLPREYATSTMFERRDDVVLQNLVQSHSPFSFEHLKTTMALDMVGSRARLRALASIGLAPETAGAGDGALTPDEQVLLDEMTRRYKLEADISMAHSSSALDQIVLRAKGNDPAVVRALVAALRENYIADSRRRIHEILTSTREFFASEVARIQHDIAVRDAALGADVSEFPGLDATDLVGVGTRLELVRSERDQLLQRRVALEADVSAREAFLRNGPTDPMQAPWNAGLATAPPRPAKPIQDTALDQAVDEIQRQMVDLLTLRRMTPEHPEARALQARLDAIEALRGEVASRAPTPDDVAPASDPLADQAWLQWRGQQVRVELELDALRKQLAVANEQLDASEARLRRFQDVYARLASRDEEIRRTSDDRAKLTQDLAVWQSHLVGLERIATAESGQRGTQFLLIEDAKELIQPTRPQLAAVFATCTGLGFAGAALLLALAELLDRSFRSAAQVTRAIGLPVLECISLIPTPREKRRAAVRRLVWTPIVSLVLSALLGSAAMAYMSLRMPHEHAQIVTRADRLLAEAGVPRFLPTPPEVYRTSP